LTLSDAQARILVQQLGPIEERHAQNKRQHRPFVHDFVRAVYHATGRTHSAGFYRKLLIAYAPDRTPSTPTIETEKNLLEHELARNALNGEMDTRSLPAHGIDSDQKAHGAGAPVTQSEAPRPADPAQLQAIGLLQHLAARFDQFERASNGADRTAGLQAHNDYLRERLEGAETELAALRKLAAQMTATAQEEASLAAERGRQLEVLHQRAGQQAAALAALAVTSDDNRKFFAMQVDGVRGETRAMRERCTQLEQLLKEKDKQMDMYRQMALSKSVVLR
jgi:hypothetical protein